MAGEESTVEKKENFFTLRSRKQKGTLNPFISCIKLLMTVSVVLMAYIIYNRLNGSLVVVN